MVLLQATLGRNLLLRLLWVLRSDELLWLLLLLWWSCLHWYSHTKGNSSDTLEIYWFRWWRKCWVQRSKIYSAKSKSKSDFLGMKLFPPFQLRIFQKSEFQVCLEILYEEPVGEHSLSKLTNFDFYIKVGKNKKKIQKHKKEKIQTGKNCPCRQFRHHLGTSCNLPERFCVLKTFWLPAIISWLFKIQSGWEFPIIKLC